MTDEEMELFIDKCYVELETKQKVLQDSYNLDNYQNYRVDQEKECLQFKNSDIVMLEFNVIFIGTWIRTKNDWLWAWANGSITDSAKEKSSIIQKLGEMTQKNVFLNPNFPIDESGAWEIFSLAVHILNANGLYRAPQENSELFIAVMDKK